jgi:hypothetical protein
MRNLVIFASLLAAATPLSAAPAYRASGFMRTGYSEKVLGPDAWAVRGTGRERNKSVSVALYRAAELARDAGASEVRVTRQRIKSQAMIERRTGYERSYYETAELTVRAIRSDADRTACEMPEAAKCMTLPVAGILATYGPKLDMAAALPGEAPTAPLPIATRSNAQQRMMADFLARHPQMRAPAAVPAVPAAPARITPVAPPVPVARAATYAPPATVRRPGAAAPTAAEAYAALLRAQQPVKSGPGWKMSD